MLEFQFPPNLNNGFNNCEDAMISSVVYNGASRYECLHALYWGMRYFAPSPERKSLNDRFYISGLFRLDNAILKELFGLEFCERRSENRDAFWDEVCRRLDEGQATVLRMDTFDCPWNVGYRNYHRQHFVIVTGVGERGVLVCHDPFCKVQSGRLPLDALATGSIDFFHYSFQSPTNPCSNERLLHKMARAYLEQEFSDDIRGLAEELREYDLYREVKDIPFDSICLAPFFIQLRGIVSSRSNLIDFVAVLCARLRTVAKPAFERLAESWNVVYCVLIKAMTRGGGRQYMEQAADLLLQIALEEQALAAELVQAAEETI